MKRAAFTLAVIFTVVGALFVGGETVDDPGGWKAAGLIAAWAVPLVVLGLLAWRRPGPAARVLTVVVVADVAVSVWFAVDSGAWRSVEQGNGPIRAVVTFALASALAPLGLHRPRLTGVLLLVVGLVPPVLAGAGSRHGASSLVAASIMPVVVGSLYLLDQRWRSSRRTVRPADDAAASAALKSSRILGVKCMRMMSPGRNRSPTA